MTDTNFIKKKIVNDLKPLNPKKIIVFGSFSQGKFIKGKSDIDLLIIKNSKLKPADRYSQARLLLSLKLPFDIFTLSEKELKEKLPNSFFFREVVKRGEIIYEHR